MEIILSSFLVDFGTVKGGVGSTLFIQYIAVANNNKYLLYLLYVCMAIQIHASQAFR